MDDRARTDDGRSLSVHLQLRLDEAPISGRLQPERGPDEEFVGWLGFVEALRRLSDAQSHERSEDL
jgi:hypothetical protein